MNGRARYRVAGAPITWGVCEVPGWGHQMCADRVLKEMTGLGLDATEAGPDGFLPRNPDELRVMLDGYNLRLVGAFLPVVLHRPAVWEIERATALERMRTIAEAGGEIAVVAASTGAAGYEDSSDLDDAAWNRLAVAVDDLSRVADTWGVMLTVHPHYGTVIERPAQVERFLSESSAPLCLDTGHLMVGGSDAVEVARLAAGRIGHVHLKDVDASLAEEVRAGTSGYREAVAKGLYRPLGEGDVDLAGLFASFDEQGYSGWLVLEQDVVLAEEPPEDGGPQRQLQASLHHLETVIGMTIDHPKTERGGIHAN